MRTPETDRLHVCFLVDKVQKAHSVNGIWCSLNIWGLLQKQPAARPSVTAFLSRALAWGSALTQVDSSLSLLWWEGLRNQSMRAATRFLRERYNPKLGWNRDYMKWSTEGVEIPKQTRWIIQNRNLKAGILETKFTAFGVLFQHVWLFELLQEIHMGSLYGRSWAFITQQKLHISTGLMVLCRKSHFDLKLTR